MNKSDEKILKIWKKEIYAKHRWGRNPTAADREYEKLKKQWDAAIPLDESCRKIVKQIIALEICNWNLQDSIIALCSAIGTKEPASLKIGHMNWLPDSRWMKVWAYYFALRDWLTHSSISGYRNILDKCDPREKVRRKINNMLGDHTKVKDAYVERMCLCLEFWLGGFFSIESISMKAHRAAVEKIESIITELDPDGNVANLEVFDEIGGKLQLCHHKLFRRYDIIISSIGAEQWRAALPERGTDGFKRAELINKYITPIEDWAKDQIDNTKLDNNETYGIIIDLLGLSDDTKRFLALFLVSLLRSQEIAARHRAEKRA